MTFFYKSIISIELNIMNNKKIFILDLDGTIIGNCSYQADLYNLQNLQKKNSIKIINNNNMISSYKNNSRLIRPFFNYFYNKIKKYYPESYIFIYTASDALWAKKEIEYIEKGNNIKFNRPFFTRDDCILSSNGEYKKSITKIIPKISKVIKDKNFNYKDNIIIIDNNNTFLDYNSNFLLCKTYDYVLFFDMWDCINLDYYKYNDLNYFITNLINNNKIFKESINTNTSDKKLEQIYKWKYKKIKKINKVNNSASKDIFWKKITDLLISNNFTKFNRDTIYYLQKHI